MNLLPILYWILLILAVIGAFAPPAWSMWSGRVALVLFILLGLRVFPFSLQ